MASGDTMYRVLGRVEEQRRREEMSREKRAEIRFVPVVGDNLL
jgi:hypothetical protein